MIYLIRHGQSEANTESVFAGQRNDCELTDRGREQARAVGEKLKSISLDIERVVSSPLKRTRETAEIITKVIGFGEDRIIYDEGIQEYDMGSITNSPVCKIKSSELVAAEGAEDAKTFQKRILDTLRKYSSQNGNTLVISHAGVGRMVQAYKKGVEPNDFYSIEPYPNGHILELETI